MQRALTVGIDRDTLVVSSIAVDIVDHLESLIMSQRDEQFLDGLSSEVDRRGEHSYRKLGVSSLCCQMERSIAFVLEGWIV